MRNGIGSVRKNKKRGTRAAAVIAWWDHATSLLTAHWRCQPHKHRTLSGGLSAALYGRAPNDMYALRAVVSNVGTTSSDP